MVVIFLIRVSLKSSDPPLMVSGQGGRKETLVTPHPRWPSAPAAMLTPRALGTPCDPASGSHSAGPGRPRGHLPGPAPPHCARGEDGAWGASVGEKRRGPALTGAPSPPPARSYATVCVNKSGTLFRDSMAGPRGSQTTRAPLTGRKAAPGRPREPEDSSPAHRAVGAEG